jgi:hypothetical protein
LLALKRHEQPPPGYFNGFSREVITRIKAGDVAADSFFDRVTQRLPWLRHLSFGLEAKPIVAGAFGVGVCSLLVVGLVSSERIDANPGSFAPVTESPAMSLATVPNQSVGSLFERSSADHTITQTVYTAQSRSIFDEIQRPHLQKVNFSVTSGSN